jgi:hypothetical protein
MRPSGLRSAAELAADKPHGTRIKYVGGCKCLKCRMANSNFEMQHAALRRAGLGNPLMDAAEARAHIIKLARRGIGYKSVAEAAKLNHGTVYKIRSGQRTQARRATLQRILKVTVNCRSDGAHVPAGRLWRWINSLLEEGYSKRALARMLGRKSPSIQFRRDYVTLRNHAKVERLYRKLMGIDAPPFPVHHEGKCADSGRSPAPDRQSIPRSPSAGDLAPPRQ